MAAPADPYIAYIHRFFHKWLPVYDWFARSIFWAYGATVRQIAPKPGLRVLDICTGTGEIALRCARRGADVTGIDVTPEMLAKARAKASKRESTSAIRFEVMDARDLDFPDSSFDVAVIGFALHDMPRPVRLLVLREAARVASRRLVIFDYDMPHGELLRRVATRLVALFETAYFKSFAAEGALPLLAESELVPATGASAPAPRIRRIFPYLFSIFEIKL